MAHATRAPPFPVRASRWALSLAVVLVAGLWLRGEPSFVVWDLSRDHDRCFSRDPLSAKVWSGERHTVADWFLRQGTQLPSVPDRVGELSLVGARYCPLASLSFAPHVYYRSPTSHVSLFVLPRKVRLGDRFAALARGDSVRLLRVEGEVVGIVAEREADAEAFEMALRPALAAWAARSR